MKNRNVAWIRYDSTIICSALLCFSMLILFVPFFPLRCIFIWKKRKKKQSFSLFRSMIMKWIKTKFKTWHIQREYCLWNFHQRYALVTCISLQPALQKFNSVLIWLLSLFFFFFFHFVLYFWIRKVFDFNISEKLERKTCTK